MIRWFFLGMPILAAILETFALITSDKLSVRIVSLISVAYLIIFITWFFWFSGVFSDHLMTSSMESLEVPHYFDQSWFDPSWNNELPQYWKIGDKYYKIRDLMGRKI